MRVALRGILANRMRSALTMLGILIGTAAVILLVAVGTGISNQVQVQIRNLGTNAVYILPERNQGGQDRGGTSARRVRLTKADVKALSDRTRAPSVDLVAPTVGASGTVTWQGTTYALQNFVGGSPEFGEIRNTPVAAGRFLTDEDVASHAKVAVIGTTVVDHLFPTGVDPVGQQVEFNGVTVPDHRRPGPQGVERLPGPGRFHVRPHHDGHRQHRRQRRLLHRSSPPGRSTRTSCRRPWPRSPPSSGRRTT